MPVHYAKHCWMFVEKIDPCVQRKRSAFRWRRIPPSIRSSADDEWDVMIKSSRFRLYSCIAQDQLQYFVFDYLKDWRNIDVINEKNLAGQFQDFIQRNLFPIETLVLPERKILGPGKYNRAALLSVGVPPSNTTLNDTLGIFCANQSSIGKSFFFSRLFLSEIESFSRFLCSWNVHWLSSSQGSRSVLQIDTRVLSELYLCWCGG